MQEQHTPDTVSIAIPARRGTRHAGGRPPASEFPSKLTVRGGSASRPHVGTRVAPSRVVLDTPRPLASLPANLAHTCPVCGHGMAVMVAETPKGRLTQCASCGELDYRRTVLAPLPAPPGRS